MTGTDLQLFRDNCCKGEYLHNTIEVILNDVFDIMKESYGPHGSHVMIDTNIRPEATKDGKTILSNLTASGSIPTAILKSIVDVADKQVEEVGDGSTTTTLLLCRLYKYFRETIKRFNISASVFQQTLSQAVSEISKELSKKAIPVVIYGDDGEININWDLLTDAVRTSVDGDNDLTKIIIDMYKELNSIEPLILIETSPTTSHRYDLVTGAEVEASIISSEIFFNGYSRFSYENPRIVIINGRLEIDPAKFLDITQDAMRNTPIIFLCTSISESLVEMLTTMNNNNPGSFNNVALSQIRKTSLDDEFLDMCATLGCTPIDGSSTSKWATSAGALKAINASAGGCTKALLTEFCARFNGPKSNKDMVAERLAIIERQIADLKEDSSSHNTTIITLEERKAFLSCKFAKLYVGGQSPQRKAINYELAADGIPQAQSCMKHGITIGCNMIMLDILKDIDKTISDDDKYGFIKSAIYSDINKAYLDVLDSLVANAVGDEFAHKFVDNHLMTNGIVPMDLRDINYKDGKPVASCGAMHIVNSADTDRAILTYATDMAALLATTKGFINKSNHNEFDIINKRHIFPE